MNAGELRDRVTLFTVNQATGAEIDFATVWAEVDVATGQTLELEQAQRSTPNSVRIRHLAGVVPQMRIRFGARRFEVLTVRPVGRKRELCLVVREFVA